MSVQSPAPQAPAKRATTAILFANHRVEIGGAERSLLDFLSHLDRERFVPHLACADKGPLAERAWAMKVELHFVPTIFDGVLGAVGRRRSIGALRAAVKAHDIGLIYANSLDAVGCTVAAATKAGVPSVCHVRETSIAKSELRHARRATWCIADSNAVAAALGIENVTVVHDGVDARFFEQGDSRAQVRNELKLPNGQRLVALLGHLQPGKGHHLLVRAAQVLRERCPGTTYLLIGEPTAKNGQRKGDRYRADLEKIAAELRVADDLRFLSNRDDVPRLLAASDVLVYASEEPEPFPHAIVEAQAVGLPAVAAKHGGALEIVEDGRDGLMVKPGDVGALAAGLQRMLSDVALRAQFGATARVKAEKCWRADTHARAIEKVWASVLADTAAKS